MCSSFVTPWHQIKALIKTYIQRQETINLVVVPCNVDIATTEALSMAQEVDPDGDRTIGKKKAPTGSRGRPLRYLEGPGCNSPVRGAHILHQIRALFPGKLRGLRVQLHTADGPPSLMVRARCMANIWRLFASFLLSLICILNLFWIGGERCLILSPTMVQKGGKDWPINCASPGKDLTRACMNIQGIHFQVYTGAQVSTEFIFK